MQPVINYLKCSRENKGFKYFYNCIEINNKMHNKKEIDIVDKILEACYQNTEFPLFIMSLMHQYEEKGSLSKKQLQGLYYKAEKVPDLPANLLATLQAKIAKMPNRYKQEAVISSKPLYKKDENTGKLMQEILSKYPQHKRVVFLQMKYNNNETLSAAETAEIEKFKKILL